MLLVSRPGRGSTGSVTMEVAPARAEVVGPADYLGPGSVRFACYDSFGQDIRPDRLPMGDCVGEFHDLGV